MGRRAFGRSGLAPGRHARLVLRSENSPLERDDPELASALGGVIACQSSRPPSPALRVRRVATRSGGFLLLDESLLELAGVGGEGIVGLEHRKLALLVSERQQGGALRAQPAEGGGDRPQKFTSNAHVTGVTSVASWGAQSREKARVAFISKSPARGARSPTRSSRGTTLCLGARLVDLVGARHVSQPCFERAVSFAVLCGGDTDNSEHGRSDRGRPRRRRGHSPALSRRLEEGEQGRRHGKSA